MKLKFALTTHNNFVTFDENHVKPFINIKTTDSNVFGK